MALSAGDQLGPYEITAPLGAGGMGEVYKARDTRLDRSVAIKVLPDHIAQREDSRARFEREARAVASLNHPHICTLHDIGPNYMVMELVEGETLASRIEKGPIPLDQALKQATQIADALDRAHRAGVTHRDVKPQNIMLTRDGVKVLDFGLAKSTPKTLAPSEATLTAVLTTEGTVLGTPQYMAPEQFEGKEADARSDIWAFGAVLYEMIAGQKAFKGKNYTSLVAAILGADPELLTTKPWLQRLVRRCLEKDPEDRWQTMRDVVIELKSPPEETAAKRVQSSRIPRIIAAAATLAGVAGFGLWLRNSATPPLPVRLEIAVPANRAIGRFISLSPDGKKLAWADNTNLYVRDIDAFEPRVLTQARVDGYIFWSPDGKQVGFRAGGMLKRIAASGGPAQNICDARPVLGAVWMKDDKIILGSTNAGLLRVPASGGTPEPLKVTGAPANSYWMTFPVLLPGGKKLMFVGQAPPNPIGVAIGELQPDGSLAFLREVLPGRYGAQFMIDAAGRGHLLFVQDASLMAQAFDPESLALSGDPQIITDAIGISRTRAFYTVANGGSIVFRNGDSAGTQPEFTDRTGKGEGIRTIPGALRAVSAAPNGRGVLAQINDDINTGSIWILDPDRGAHTKVPLGDKSVGRPIWSPDGKRIAYESAGLWIKPVNGTAGAELIAPAGSIPWSWSHDGKHLLIGQQGLFVLSLDGDRKPTLFLDAKSGPIQAQFSPDDRWVAYVSSETGGPEVYVRRFPDTGEQIRISNAGGSQPRWRGDGRELFYIERDTGNLMSVSIRYSKTLEAEPPVALFDSRVLTQEGSVPIRYDVYPDGKRFIIARYPETQRADPLRVILNWPGVAK